jgi:hypothetical protein
VGFAQAQQRHAKNFEWAEKTGTMASNQHVPEQNGFRHLHHVHVDLNNG